MVGIVHTNYLEYIKREKNGALQAFFVKHINNLVVRAYCHKVVVLSQLFLSVLFLMISTAMFVNIWFSTTKLVQLVLLLI